VVRFDFVLLLALTIALVVHAGPVAATSATPTYVLGVSNPPDPLIADLQSQTSSVTLLPSVSALSSIGGNSILFIDGAWLTTASSLDPTVLSSVVQTALTGVPTVVIRGSPSLLANSISGLVKSQAIGLPLISEGLQVFGTLSDGTRQAMSFQVISGFDYAVQAEFSWAQQLLSHPVATLFASSVPVQASNGLSNRASSTTATTGAYWAFIGSATISTGDQYAPVARTTFNFSIYSLQNSGSSTYKWYNFFFNNTIEPGIRIYNSGWRLAQELDHNSVNNRTTNLFVDHGPRFFGTTGPSQLTYTIGVQSGVMGSSATANQTLTYFLKNTQVTDVSQDMFNIGWQHDIAAQTAAGKLTYTVIPGWTDRINMTARVDTQGSFASSFDNLKTSQTQTITTTLGVFGG